MGILERIEREQAARDRKAADEIVGSPSGSGGFEAASEASAAARRATEQLQALELLRREPGFAKDPDSHLIWELMHRIPAMSQAEAAKAVALFKGSTAAPATRSKPKKRGFGWTTRFRRGQ